MTINRLYDSWVKDAITDNKKGWERFDLLNEERYERNVNKGRQIEQTEYGEKLIIKNMSIFVYVM